ncbi:tumor necrosis factor receptor superfamily member 10B-like isoform X2 [Eucyclogobius newberryi]|uniref:tumor necrosis factor receptor superfamily member 10B-like isoform X2 n=1 Tax=Eucyclogobius newberryi TaxID=166745 RepID=UPI003B59351B
MARRVLSVLVCVVWCCDQSWARPGPGPDPGLNRTRRAVHCNDDLEYRRGDLCCRNCPPGTHLKTPCPTPGGHSECEECDVGTYTELGNGLKKCLSCSLCRPDQEVVHQCISTHNTECQCKAGGFCSPDQACEVCKRCARCGPDEIVVRNCTPTSNTECKKRPLDPGRDSDLTAVYIIAGLVVLLVLVMVPLVVCVRRRNRKATDSERSEVDLTSGCNGTEKPLDSSPRCWTLEEETQFNIVPVNGQESLRGCFEFFEELDVHYHSRFFRHLGLSDNVVKSKDSLTYVDRVHDLLNLWLEKRGREARLKDLLRALTDLNQRRTAEAIVERAVEAGHFVYK